MGPAASLAAGLLRAAPAFAGWWPLRVTGLRVAGHPLAVSVDAAGRVTVDTTAPLTVNMDGG